MAKRGLSGSGYGKRKKMTRQGQGTFSKRYSKGGGVRGSTISKKYKKKYRGQGKCRQHSRLLKSSILYYAYSADLAEYVSYDCLLHAKSALESLI